MAEVLYRKWRPQRLDEVVGQEPVTQTLRRAVALGRIAHAYLLCGPRGTGKTSTARILAKSANCLAPQDGEPDNECNICLAINEGRALDLVEIDAASNRGIDDIRDLKERINYAPAEARHKVYIVDEAHMLTEPAFNALLKTLEEPPPHVIFVLATTEVHKLPLTIVSRCQRFDFRRIPVAMMVSRLEAICADEEVEATAEALTLIARTARGGLRDAVNLLEQAVVSYGSPLDEGRIRDLLELGGDETALELASNIVRKEVREGLKSIDDVAGEGADLRQLHRGVVEYLRAVLLLKSGAETSLGYPDDTVSTLRSLAEGTTLEHVVRALKAFAGADLRRDSASPLPLELAMVDSATEPPPAPQATAPPRQAPAAGARRTPDSRAARAPQAAGGGPRTAPADRTARQAPADRDRARPAPVSAAIQEHADPAVRLDSNWLTLVNSLRRSKGKRFWLGPLLKTCESRDIGDGLITLTFSHQSHMERMQEELDNPGSRKTLQDAFEKVMNGPYELRVAVVGGEGRAPAANASRTSPLVRAAQAMGARIVDVKEDQDGQQKDDEAGAAASEAHAGSSAGA